MACLLFGACSLITSFDPEHDGAPGSDGTVTTIDGASADARADAATAGCRGGPACPAGEICDPQLGCVQCVHDSDCHAPDCCTAPACVQNQCVTRSLCGHEGQPPICCAPPGAACFCAEGC